MKKGNRNNISIFNINKKASNHIYINPKNIDNKDIKNNKENDNLNKEIEDKKNLIHLNLQQCFDFLEKSLLAKKNWK